MSAADDELRREGRAERLAVGYVEALTEFDWVQVPPSLRDQTMALALAMTDWMDAQEGAVVVLTHGDDPRHPTPAVPEPEAQWCSFADGISRAMVELLEATGMGPPHPATQAEEVGDGRPRTSADADAAAAAARREATQPDQRRRAGAPHR